MSIRLAHDSHSNLKFFALSDIRFHLNCLSTSILMRRLGPFHNVNCKVQSRGSPEPGSTASHRTDRLPGTIRFLDAVLKPPFPQTIIFSLAIACLPTLVGGFKTASRFHWELCQAKPRQQHAIDNLDRFRWLSSIWAVLVLWNMHRERSVRAVSF
jgi:hypothetical protein